MIIKVQHKEQVFDVLIDVEDFNLISKRYTSLKIRSGNGYVVGYVKGSNGKQEYLHRYLSQPKENEFVDHRNRNRLDNRKKNLRNVTPKKNAQNRNVSGRSKSGVRGVEKNHNNWRVRFFVDGQRKSFGSYETIEEAEQIAKIKMGEYGCL
ncbi:HNH endonuclease [Halobacillus ihumii]|uniref:HNH endonuclease n=1 Tax=Halobacillus ihumii TaxID=2686092 RepID=UPI0013D8259C|nr:HNH endonuclease [Halobacillus ihumii]